MLSARFLVSVENTAVRCPLWLAPGALEERLGLGGIKDSTSPPMDGSRSSQAWELLSLSAASVVS